MLPVPKKWGQGWYPALKISKHLPRARQKTNRNANKRVHVYNGHAKYRNNAGGGGGGGGGYKSRKMCGRKINTVKHLNKWI